VRRSRNLATLRLKVLGSFALEDCNGRELMLPTRKTRALFAFLALRADQWTSRQRLTGLLWSDRDEVQARQSLSQALTAIRKLGTSLNTELVIAHSDRVRLNQAALETDVGLLCEQKNISASRIMSICRGPMLEGFPELDPEFAQWLTSERTVQLERCVRTLQSTIDELQRAQDYSSALSLSQRLVTLDPLLEAGHRSCVNALLGQGERMAAIRQIKRYEALLRDELDVGLSNELAELLQRISEPAGQSKTRVDFEAVAEGCSPGCEYSHAQYCEAFDGVRLAYSVVGEGEPVVRAGQWGTHIDYDWKVQTRREFMEVLSRKHAFIRYDVRGTGLSDWNVEEISFEAFLRDLETVIDVLGLKEFALFGQSQGAAIAAAYAARNPGRVKRLVMLGGFAQGRRTRGEARQLQESDALITLIKEGWGKSNPAYVQMLGSIIMPGASREQLVAFTELQRATMSPDNAARLRMASDEIDILDELDKVIAPTLVLHARDDAMVPVEQGRQLAARIKGARYIELDSSNHAPMPNEPAWRRILEEISSFLG
jgi:DNA-binding SARP family transcriptional activator/pimeloyl-ACP methyl ester carboxylesterase